MFKIHTLRTLKDNFTYVIEGPAHEAAVIDPGDAEPVRAFLGQQGLRLTHVLCTHHHWDHVNGVLALNAPVVAASACDRDRVPGCNLALSEVERLNLWGQTVEILETPGHTLGQIAYHFLREGALFTGDTLFSAGCGRLFEGSSEQMLGSMQKLKKLPLSTQIYFGHEYTLRNLDFVLSRKPDRHVQEHRAQVARQLDAGQNSSPTTLEVELRINPFLTATTVAEFTDWREARNHW